MVISILPVTMENVELRRQGRRILGPVSLTLAGRGVSVVMGPNGAGKTSLLKALHGLERTNSGRIAWAVGMDAARHRQAFVFQSPTVMRRSILDNIAYPLRLDGIEKTAARARAAEAAARVGLTEALDRPANVLSGGETQKMALARALIRGPELLFLDEPCANLDGRATLDIEAILIGARDAGTRIVMSTHNVGQARRLADEVIFLYRGAVHEASPAATFFPTPATHEARAYINGDLLP